MLGERKEGEPMPEGRVKSKPETASRVVSDRDDETTYLRYSLLK